MPNWNQVLTEIDKLRHTGYAALDEVRRKYLGELHKLSGRNIIAYYSGWLQKPRSSTTILNDNDKNGFMTTIHQLDRSKGLDLILHTPGGQMAATESIVDYLHRMYSDDIRAIVPQLAMSAGTMIACACKEIIMGRQSSLGPIDPQFGGIPASGVLEEFKKAKEEIRLDPATIPLWQAIIAKYHPTFIGECEKAVKWAKDMVSFWLKTNMFQQDHRKIAKTKRIVAALSDHGKHKSHDRHINIDDCIRLGLKIDPLEKFDDKFQDLILTIHHAYMHTFSQSTAVKIIENHNGIAMIHHEEEKN